MIQVPIEFTIITYIAGLVTGGLLGWFGCRAFAFARRVIAAIRREREAERERKARAKFARDLDEWIAEVESEEARCGPALCQVENVTDVSVGP